jgi:DNA-binding IclR family transcriptional regulator
MAAETVKSTRRTLELLECFADTKQPMTGSEIADRLGYPRSSTNALVHTLVSLGYLGVDETAKTYFPTLRVTLLGAWLPTQLPRTVDLEELLQSVRQRTRETVTLSTLAGLEMVFIRVLPGTHPIALVLDVGTPAPLFDSAVGLALLASMEDAQVSRIIRKSGLCRKQMEAPRKRLEERIKAVRKKAHAIIYDGVMPGTGALAVALPVGPVPTRIVLGVGGPADRIRSREAEFARVLKDSVAEFGHAGRAGSAA